jgi:hypothetical protein
MIFKTFSPKNWRFFNSKQSDIVQKIDHHTGFRENAIISAENCDHNIDPWNRFY